jgi:cytochrome c-type biogenesis protein CcmH
VNPRAAFRRIDVALLAVVAVVIVAAVVTWARPEERTLDERARALDVELRCPVCQGTSIADSPAVFAVQMRAVVREQLAQGASDEEVRAFFVERYGVWILLTPPTQGYEVVVWLAPVVVVAAGTGLLVRRSRRRSESDHPAALPARLGRPATAALTGAIVLALGLPLGFALAPRGEGAQISGTSAGSMQQAPSIAQLEEAAARNPRDPVVLVALADAYLGSQRTVDATALYRRALEIEPANETAALRLSVILLSAGQPSEAQQFLDAVLQRSPDNPEALLYRALAGYAVGAPPESIRADALRFLAMAGDDPRRGMAERLLDLASPKPSAAP